MIRSSIAVLFILVVVVVAFVALAPATWADRRLANATDGRLRISDAEGTVWRGRGELSDGRGAWRMPVAWHVAPSSVARGAIEVELDSTGDLNGARGGVTVADGTVALRAFTMRVPASTIRSFIPSVLPVQAGGEWIVEAPSFRYGGGATEGALDIRWDRARIAIGTATLDIGNVRLRMRPQGGQLAGTVENSGGDVQVRGDIAVDETGAKLRADIVPTTQLPAEIAQALAMLGAPDANGAVHVQWRSGTR